MPVTAFTLYDLENLINERGEASGETSYTAKLLAGGPQRAAKKFGEEAVEAALAAVAQDDTAVIAEVADVLYHLLVLLRSRKLTLGEVVNELQRRTHQSGLAEKASRTS